MLYFFLWYATITLLGLLTFPLAHRLLPALADRGYALSRTLGLLIWGFVFWLAVSLGMAQNNIGGLVLALLVLVGLVLWAMFGSDHRQLPTDNRQPTTVRTAGSVVLGPSSAVRWLKSHLRYVLSVEVLFLAAFAAWAFVRANNPEIISSGGEKWMEMAFINAIMRSPTFPPHDPWLSGFAISYYYFGYVMTAMLAEITASAGSVAFNLMVALIFGLSVMGAYGLLYNLLQAYWASDDRGPRTDNGQRTTDNGRRAGLGALLAPLFMLLMGNWETLLEVLHKQGVGWSGSAADVNLWTRLGVGYTPHDPSQAVYNFWTWLNILDLRDKPGPAFGDVLGRLASWWSAQGPAGLSWWFNEAFAPDRGGWWWWRASRVIVDYDFRGVSTEIIDEFPAFSYLLGDLHPHVLAMPFGLLLGALALNLYLGGWRGETRLLDVGLGGDRVFELKFPVRLEGFLLLAIALGGMAFLNTWAFPIYLAVVCGALLLQSVQARGWSWGLLEELLKFSIPLALLGVVLYLPFYIGFSSQAGGLLPNVIYPTRGSQLWVMFGGLFVPIFAFLLFLRGRQAAEWRKGFLLAGGFILLLWVFSTLLGIVAANTDIGRQFISDQGSDSIAAILWAATQRRFLFGGGLLTLLLVIGAAAAYLAPLSRPAPAATTDVPDGAGSPLAFVLMFILFGGLLVLAPDFVFLRDQFGARMNTVFKFYYEAWALWSIAAAFGVVIILSQLRSWAGSLFSLLVVLLVGVGLLFPVLGLPNKTNNFQIKTPQQRTLDGAAYRAQVSADDAQAILWLQSAPLGVIAEASKEAAGYSEYARVSTFSGLPAVLGWDMHESQWRGGYAEMGTRQADLRTLYATHDWGQAQAILKKYDIRYVYIGKMERDTYPVYDAKFAHNLSVIYNQGQVVIYVVP